VDLFEAIDFICDNFAIDPDRISVTGYSMGGAATWYIASHYPDRFAAAAPTCGYCDYRLWTKPGGLIMRTMPWEEYSWESRGAAFRPQNLSTMAIWITHGEWDSSIGGGVPIEHSKQMARLFDQLGIEYGKPTPDLGTSGKPFPARRCMRTGNVAAAPAPSATSSSSRFTS